MALRGINILHLITVNKVQNILYDDYSPALLFCNAGFLFSKPLHAIWEP